MASFVLTMTVTRRLTVIVDNCTEEQAKADPWKYAVDETTIDMPDWQIDDCEPND